MDNFYEDLKKYLKETPREEIERIWKETEDLDNVGPTVEEYVEYVRLLQENCPHVDKRQDSTFVYTGHNHNDDIYECTLCGKLEYR